MTGRLNKLQQDLKTINEIKKRDQKFELKQAEKQHLVIEVSSDDDDNCEVISNDMSSTSFLSTSKKIKKNSSKLSGKSDPAKLRQELNRLLQLEKTLS